MMKLLISAVALVALMAAPAMATWTEDFDSYAVGSDFAGPTHQGGWSGWDDNDDNITGAAAVVVTDAHAKSGDKSAQLSPYSDFVHTYSGYTSGQWVYTAWQYIPSAQSTTSNKTFFILMNNYNVPDGQPKSWSAQMQFDYATDLVTDQEAGGTVGVPIVYDAWKEIKVAIDLDANTRTTYYNGTEVGAFRWYDPADANHAVAIGAVDLWGDSGGAGVCYDSLSLVPEPTTLCLLAVGGLLLRRRR